MYLVFLYLTFMHLFYTHRNFCVEVLHNNIPAVPLLYTERIKAHFLYGHNETIHPAQHIIDTLGIPCNSLELRSKDVGKLLQDLYMITSR